MNEAELKRFFERLARKHLGLDTLDERKSDSLDFHEVFAPAVLDALREAYDTGLRDGKIKWRR